ncbi:MAG: dockerin type I repeat-containing protein, partial [Clostridia bacterium]|nr:dockerin type I repeat-containing protein [Clostridia bacterium]
MKMKKLISTVLAGAMLLGSAVIFTSGAEDTEKTLTPLKMYGVTVSDGQVLGIPGNPTVGEFKAMFAESAESLTVSYGDKALSDTDLLPTGAILANGSVSAGVHVYGDTNSDGKINLSDVSSLLKKIAGWEVSLDGTACDVNLDEKTNLTDASNILKKIAGWRVFLGNTMIPVTEEPQKAAKEDSSLLLAFGNGIDRYTPDTQIGDAVTDVMYCAKNEIEFTQFALRSDVGHEGLSVEITPFTNSKGHTVRTEMYCENFITIADARSDVDKIADIMSPILDGISVKADAIQPFGIKAFTEEDTPYGMYEATVSVKDAEGNQIKKALVFLYVWDFILPEATNCRSSFGLFAGNIGSSSTATVEERYKNYYDFFIENRMNPSLLPYDICSDEAVEYLNDPRVNSFLAGGEGYGGAYDTTDEQLRERYTLLSQNEEWMKKAYFYYDDEPLNFEVDGKAPVAEQIASIKSNYEHVRELFPGAKILIPNHYNAIDERFEGDIVGYCIKYSSILCPHMWMFN